MLNMGSKEKPGKQKGEKWQRAIMQTVLLF